jgi:hypothetical protein
MNGGLAVQFTPTTARRAALGGAESAGAGSGLTCGASGDRSLFPSFPHRELMERGLHSFEAASMVNLMPTNADEAKSHRKPH